MRIGVPREIKTLEGRVALIPAAAAALIAGGHEVLVQQGAGQASGYRDADYQQLGARLVADAAALYGEAQLVVKVKEPLPDEYGYLRADQILFCYLHLAAIPDLARALCASGITAVGWETVQEADGRLPLLVPMSAVAGHLAVQLGANLLLRPHEGQGLLLGGLAGAERGHVVILGGGTVGRHAAQLAAALGARITVFSRSPESLERAHRIGAAVTALPAFEALYDREVRDADVLVGAVLVPGGRAPVLIPEDTVAAMRPGSVIVDVSVDQGGCVATTRPTLWDAPSYRVHEVTHFAVTNMPGAVPRTASQMLSAALVPYLLRLAAADGLRDDALRRGINVAGGAIVHPAVRAAVEGSAQ